MPEVPLFPIAAAPRACPKCGTELAANLLSCPACGWLVHGAELQRLADQAAVATQPAEALAHWRRAFALLPKGSRQQQLVLDKINALVRIAESAPAAVPTAPQPGKPAAPKSLWGRIAAGLGVSAAFAAKFKFVIILILSKAKLLLLGLTKMSTLISMFVSFGVYWSLWGWKFAAGFVLSIYVHEMGHVFMLRQLGIHATAPMFIPGFGAIIRARERFTTAREEALVGLAGPMWGLGAALAAYALSLGFHSPMFSAIAYVGALINLFNLTPVWQLDGSHAFRALTRRQRWIVAAVVLAAFLATSVGILILVLLFAVIRAFEKEAAPEPGSRALAEFVFLVAALSLLASIPVPAGF